MRGLQRIQTTQEIQQFVKVWQFSDALDEITWCLTPDEVLHKISLYNSILGFLCGQQLGQIVEGQGGEQMQGVGMADITK
jgi:hypothetical protein